MPPPSFIFTGLANKNNDLVYRMNTTRSNRRRPVSRLRGDNMTFKYLKNEKGQGLTEYALIIALVAIVAVAALTLLGGQIDSIFGDITTDLGGAGAV